MVRALLAKALLEAHCRRELIAGIKAYHVDMLTQVIW